MIATLLEHPGEPEGAGEPALEDGVLRYDDLVQDGRLRLESAWRPTGRSLWSIPAVAAVFKSMGKDVTNVLSRSSLVAAEVPLAPRAQVRTSVSHRFEHVLGPSGDVERLLFSTWLTARAMGRDGNPAPVARAYGQRVFTRLHAPPGQHLVTRLDGFGPSGIPPHRAEWRPVTTVLELPRGAELLDPSPRWAASPTIFGVTHTDLNHHVNFLMYHREVERAALVRASELGLGSKLLAREVTFGYRRPSFAGEVVRVALQAFRLGEAFGVLAAVVDQDTGDAVRASFRDFGSPRVVACMVLRP